MSVPAGFEPVSQTPSPAPVNTPVQTPQASTQFDPVQDRSWTEQVGGALTMAQSFSGALAENRIPEYVNMIRRGQFARAKDEFGFLSKPMLERGAKSGNQIAQYLLKHPVETATAQFLTDWFDPIENLAGKGLGAIAGKGAKYIAQTDSGRALLSAFSPFKKIAANAGEEGKAKIMAMLTRMTGSAANAQKKALEIFNGLSPEEKFDVIHLHQGQNQAVKTQDPARLAVLGHRAQKLHDYITLLSGRQIAFGTLEQAVGMGRPDYFPMKGAFNNPKLTQQKQDFFEAQRGSGSGGAVPRETTESRKAVYKNLAEAQAAGAAGTGAGIRPDWEPVHALEKWAAQRGARVEFESSLKDLPPSMLRPLGPNAKRTNQFGGYHVPGAQAPLDARGREMLSPAEIQKNMPELYRFVQHSPGLEKSWMSQDFVDFLNKRSTRLYKSDKEYPTGNDLRSKIIRGALEKWDGYNETMRNAIITNPIYHPLFNLSNNALGAGLPLHEVAGLVSKNLVNTLTLGKFDKFANNVSQPYQQALLDAWKAGAVAEIKSGGEKTTQRLAARWQDLSTPDKFLKIGDHIQDWNTRMTFGPRGEQAFSIALFKNLKAKNPNLSDPEIGKMVREALGNYQNVEPGAWQSRVFFFYPWLKGNMAFWTRNAVLNPKAAYSYEDAVRRNNQIVDDPDEKDYRKKDYSFTYGNKKDGFGSGTLPLPQRMFRDVESLESDDPAKIGKTALNIGATRLQPGFEAGYDAINTLTQRPSDPSLPQNFHTIIDTEADRPTQARQALGYAAGKLPIPLAGYQVKDAIREGGGDLREGIVSALSGTNIHADENKQTYKQEMRVRAQFERRVKVANKIKNPAQKQRLLDAAHATYKKRMEQLEHKTKIAPKNTTQDGPPGFEPVGPSGFEPVAPAGFAPVPQN